MANIKELTKSLRELQNSFEDIIYSYDKGYNDKYRELSPIIYQVHEQKEKVTDVDGYSWLLYATENYPTQIFDSLDFIVKHSSAEAKTHLSIKNNTDFYLTCGISKTYHSLTTNKDMEEIHVLQVFPNDIGDIWISESPLSQSEVKYSVKWLSFSTQIQKPVKTVTYVKNLDGSTDSVDVHYQFELGESEVSIVVCRSNPNWTEGNRCILKWNTKADGSGTNYSDFATITNDLTLYAVWGYEYRLTYKTDEGCVDHPSTYTAVIRSATQTATHILISCPFKLKTGYRAKNYAFINASGGGTNQAIGEQVSVYNNNCTATVNTSNKYTITYKHTNNTSWYAASGTGRLECYALYINGVMQDKLGAFSNGQKTITATYGDKVEVACTYALDSNYVESIASIKVNGLEIANTNGSAAYGYYPYANSDSFKIPNNDVKEVAYFKSASISQDMTINFIAQTNLSLVQWVNKQERWDCEITM